MSNTEFNCIIPTLTKDYIETRDYLYDLFDMFSISKLIILGPEKLRDTVTEDATDKNLSDKVSFINGNELVPYELVQNAYNNRLNELRSRGISPDFASPSGWYYQQFLKLAYCEKSDTDYYLCWDADTIPLRKTRMFGEDNKPYLDLKSEYIPSYFKTIKSLFGFGKTIEKSFISGHMLFNAKYVKEMINDIMSTRFRGSSFYEKVFDAVSSLDHGFSEFETYGTWVAINHTEAYNLRIWHSIRNASLLINRKDLTTEDIEWLSSGFDAANFERYQSAIPELTELFRSPVYRKKMNSDTFYTTLLESGVFGDYRDGGLAIDDIICPA